jgi:glycosyltransferase involved in cell wall biosynthesis
MVANGILLKETAKIRKIAFVGDHLPRKCGIATFTTDLLSAVQSAYPQSQCLCVSVNDIEDGYDYPEVVRFEIEEQDLPSYLRAADFLNISDVDIVCLQHEFGIFGGPAGGHILAMLRELKMPVVTTLAYHSARTQARPAARHRRADRALHAAGGDGGSRTADAARNLPGAAEQDRPDSAWHSRCRICGSYLFQRSVPGGRPHRSAYLRLLSPNKGIEYVLNALPAVLAEFPDVVYIVLGATHPNELRNHGEAYRLSLEILATKNKLEKHVIFCNQFVDPENLKEFMGAADLYITPYLNEAQITSGTLSFAFGSGKAVVSTPYWHAADLLADDRGALVPFADSAAMAEQILGLLRDDTRRNAMRKNAYRLGREMIWSNVAQLYMHSFELARLEGAPLSRNLSPSRPSTRSIVSCRS